MKKTNRCKIDEFAIWLRQVPWRFFCTFTFARRNVSDRQAEKVFGAFINRLESHLRCEVCFVRGDEKRFSGCGMPASGRHFHALLTCLAPVQPKLIESLWTSMAGSRADGAGAMVEHYNPNEDGVQYVLKRIYDPDGNWDFSNNFELFHPEIESSRQNKRSRRRLQRFRARQEMFGNPQEESL